MWDRVTPKKWRFAAIVIFCIEIVIIFLYSFFPESFLSSFMGTVGIIGAFIVILTYPIFWRCPQCKRLLPLEHIAMINRCPYCGEYIE